MDDLREQLAAQERRIAEMERRLAELETRDRVKAPFRVVDDQGQSGCEAEGGRMAICDAAGERVATLRAREAAGVLGLYGGDGLGVALGLDKDGGYVAVRSRTDRTAAVLCVDEGRGNLEIHNAVGEH